jgi:hypothetical protein
MKRKEKTFTIRQRPAEHDGRQLWQIGQDVCGDASYYSRQCARRWFQKFVNRGMRPVFENGAIEPPAVD